eukprot:TRINITY_DN89439_c0_g1_i1.p1 TRINITY_DN89439_c0_g1~~TRINITY_DN89439_c0_g1_i1.p1  ORF type:complete len:643 (+),score=158.52 TRINITY_DN89439_c0_g1_i1:32-1960(+)
MSTSIRPNMAAPLLYLVFAFLTTEASRVTLEKSDESAAVIVGGNANEFPKAVLQKLDLTTAVAKNCLPDIVESFKGLEAACTETHVPLQFLNESVPLFTALKDTAEVIGRPDCVDGASAPMPRFLVKATEIVINGSTTVLATEKTLELTNTYVTTVKTTLQQKDYVRVGSLTGELLLALAGQAGAVPMLQGLASVLDEAGEGVDKLDGCSHAVVEGAEIVKSMQVSLKPPKGSIWKLGRVDPKDFVTKLQEMATNIQAAQNILVKCIPAKVSANVHIQGFKSALQQADDFTRNGQTLILMGMDVAREFDALGAAALAGNWETVGKSIGEMAITMSSGQSGLLFIDYFVRAVTGFEPHMRALVHGFENVNEIKLCIQSSRAFVDTCKETFKPLGNSTEQGREVLGRLSGLLDSAQSSVAECRQIDAHGLDQLLLPELSMMGTALDSALEKAQYDTKLLISGYTAADDFKKVAAALNTFQLGEASKQMADVLSIVNDNLNADSFLKGLLTTLGEHLETLPSCVGDVRRIMKNLREAAWAMEISPRKLTIDKNDVDKAMAALGNVVQATHDMLNSCSDQISALRPLLKAVLKKKWEQEAGQLNMFNENIAQLLWKLGKAIVDRDWTSAGQALGSLALMALKAAEH